MNDIIENIKKKYGIIFIEEALKSWANGHCIACYIETHSYTYRFDGKNPVMRDGFYSIGISKDMVNEGVWYIEI